MSRQPGRRLDGDVTDVDVCQVLGTQHARLVEDLEETEDVPGARQVDPVGARQTLNAAELDDVPLGKPPAVGGRALRSYQPQALVHHQGARVGGQDFRRHTDGVNRLVQADVAVARGGRVQRPPRIGIV